MRQSLSEQVASDYMQGVRGLALEALSWPWLPDWQRLEWAAVLLKDVVPIRELPQYFLDARNLTRRDIGVDLVSLDGALAVQCKCYCTGRVASGFGMY